MEQTTYQQALDNAQEYGEVDQVHWPLVLVRGLPGARLGELVLFDDSSPGQVIALEDGIVKVALLSRESRTSGEKLARTGRPVEVPVGPGLRGKIISPLGRDLESHGQIQSGVMEYRPTDTPPPPIMHRARVGRPLNTGVSIVDGIVPLGKGQREAVIGDPKTGKTSFLMSAARAQAKEGVVVYAMIGRPWSEIKRVRNFLKENTEVNNVVMVATSADDVAGLVELTPHSAMTIAEYWRDQGMDVSVILYDMSTHAKYHREISLLAKKFPGRESYPGDMFYVHARILERAGNFKQQERGDAAITCLAAGETVNGDVTNYIASNLIGITDGHLFFDAVKFSEGQRPAVDVNLSVTRVGQQVQSHVLKELNRDIMNILTKHAEAQKYTRFGSEVTEEMSEMLVLGQRLYRYFTQGILTAVPVSVQMVCSLIIRDGWLNDVPSADIPRCRDSIVDKYSKDEAFRDMLDGLMTSRDLPDFRAKVNAKREEILNVCQSETISRKS